MKYKDTESRSSRGVGGVGGENGQAGEESAIGAVGLFINNCFKFIYNKRFSNPRFLASLSGN